MTVFRPATRVTSPDGREWELYAYKVEVRDRRDWETDVVDADVGMSSAAAGLALLNAIVWLVTLVPRLVVRLADVAAAGLRALRSDEWTVEAISFLPQRQSYVWKTAREYRGQVLAQVEGSLARGEVPRQLRNATYVGWSRSAR